MSEWRTSGFAKHVGPEKIRKTMSFYGRTGNFYIDSSDGINEDLGVEEYCGRIMRIVEECRGKKFLMFKTSYSSEKTKTTREIAQRNGGDVLPFFIMCYYQDFYDETQYHRKNLIKLKEATKKKYDIGFCAGLEPYKHPKPAVDFPLVAWTDKWHFGIGSGEHNGYYYIKTRQDLYDKLVKSRFNFYHHGKMGFNEYMRKSFEWKICLNPPGIGEYSARMLEHSALGQAVVLRKNSYDNAISYKKYWPEIDFNKEGWEDDLQNIVDNYKYWEKRSGEYYSMVYDSKTAITGYIRDKLEEYGIC